MATGISPTDNFDPRNMQIMPNFPQRPENSPITQTQPTSNTPPVETYNPWIRGNPQNDSTIFNLLKLIFLNPVANPTAIGTAATPENISNAWNNTSLKQQGDRLQQEEQGQSTPHKLGSIAREIPSGAWNAILALPQMAGGIAGGVYSDIVKDPAVSQFMNGLTGSSTPLASSTKPDASSAPNPSGMGDNLSETDSSIVPEKAPVDIQKYYEAITKFESTMPNASPEVKQKYRAVMAQKLSEKGAPSDLVSMYSVHGGGAPALHQDYQTKLAMQQERPEQALMKQAIQQMFTSDLTRRKELEAQLKTAKPDELKKIPLGQGDDPLVVSGWFGSNAQPNPLAIQKFIDNHAPMPDPLKYIQMMNPKKEQKKEVAKQQAINSVLNKGK